MNIIYALEEMPRTFSQSIFLAGPTPRSDDVKSWRIEALEILNKLNYKGVVFVPEPRDGKWKKDYEGQVEWEQKHRRVADIILFWVPRDLKTMPAFTTNVEFGEDYNTAKAIYGRPKEAPKNQYLDTLYQQATKETPKETLEETLKQALEKIGEGASRSKGERYIPIHLWKNKSFQAWYKAQVKVGNRLEEAKILSQFLIKNNVFSFQLWVKVWIEEERRFKENEFIIGRTDISTVALLYKPSKGDTQVVLVKEFRSPVRNEEGYVYELCGGSSFNLKDDPLKVAAEEIHEETGLEVDKGQIKPIVSRQLMATWSTHHSYLFSCWLTDEQFKQATEAALSKKVFGNEADTERTYLQIFSIKELLNGSIVDWSTLGMIFQALETPDGHL